MLRTTLAALALALPTFALADEPADTQAYINWLRAERRAPLVDGVAALTARIVVLEGEEGDGGCHGTALEHFQLCEADLELNQLRDEVMGNLWESHYAIEFAGGCRGWALHYLDLADGKLNAAQTAVGNGDWVSAMEFLLGDEEEPGAEADLNTALGQVEAGNAYCDISSTALANAETVMAPFLGD